MVTRDWHRFAAPPPGTAQSLGVSPFQAHLLFNRGITNKQQMDSFLTIDEVHTHDPFLLPDMDKAVKRLDQSLNSSDPIGVFGDFDMDGISGTALLVSALREIGGTVTSYLPHRVQEGHGLNEDAILTLKSRGVSLLITVDCGTSSSNEIRLASSIGMDTIITDHHTVSSPLPAATALVNPNRPDSRYPYSGLTGAGLSLKLVEGLWMARGKKKPVHLYELAALGTIADVGPLTDENRIIVREGLARLNNTRYPGIKALMDLINLEQGTLDTESLSFGLIPRLNASGRLSTAQTSLDLLLSSTVDEARPLAEDLDRQNLERRTLTAKAVQEAKEQVEAKPDGPPPIIIVEHTEWLPGILGLIASNLSELYYRPVVAVRNEGDLSRASARSIREFDMIATLHRTGAPFERVGGHPMAAGFTISTKDLPNLILEMTEIASLELAETNLRPKIHIDCEITPKLLSNSNFEFIESLGPFGAGNPRPVFLTRNATVTSARQVGSDRKHLKFQVSHSGGIWNAIAFRRGDDLCAPGSHMDLVYTIQKNTWNGNVQLELNVIDFHTTNRSQASDRTIPYDFE